MADIFDKATRSQMMSNIRGMNTQPEVRVRSFLHKQGFRFRVHVKTLPGKPDIVLPKHRVVILVHGCFWHGHDCCLFKWPKTRQQFWKKKIEGNKKNDGRILASFKKADWRVAVVWECALKGRNRLDNEVFIKRLVRWIQGNSAFIEIKA